MFALKYILLFLFLNYIINFLSILMKFCKNNHFMLLYIIKHVQIKI